MPVLRAPGYLDQRVERLGRDGGVHVEWPGRPNDAGAGGDIATALQELHPYEYTKQMFTREPAPLEELFVGLVATVHHNPLRTFVDAENNELTLEPELRAYDGAQEALQTAQTTLIVAKRAALRAGDKVAALRAEAADLTADIERSERRLEQATKDKAKADEKQFIRDQTARLQARRAAVTDALTAADQANRDAAAAVPDASQAVGAAEATLNLLVRGGYDPAAKPKPTPAELAAQLEKAARTQAAVKGRLAFRRMGWWEDADDGAGPGSVPTVAPREAAVAAAEQDLNVKSATLQQKKKAQPPTGRLELRAAEEAYVAALATLDAARAALERVKSMAQFCFVSYQYVSFTSAQAMEINADAGILGIRPYVPVGSVDATRVTPGELHAAKRRRVVHDVYDHFGAVDPHEHWKKSQALRRVVGAWRIGKVLDTKAAEMPGYEGGPAERGHRLTVNVCVEWWDWRKLRRAYTPYFFRQDAEITDEDGALGEALERALQGAAEDHRRAGQRGARRRRGRRCCRGAQARAIAARRAGEGRRGGEAGGPHRGGGGAAAAAAGEGGGGAAGD